MAVRALRVEDAVGYRLFHDYTCIEPGFKGAIKHRGEVITPSDVELLKKCGHSYVYVYDVEAPRPGFVHEEEAVTALALSLAGSNVTVVLAEEAKALLLAEKSGLLLVRGEALREVNSRGLFVVVTRRTGHYARRGDLIGVVDLIPLYIHRELLNEHVEVLAEYKPVISVIENKHPKIGVVVTGNEIIEGLKRDLAGPVVVEKIKYYECTPGRLEYARDYAEEISNKILSILGDHDAVIVTGGMSVDPTDQTPRAIASIADEVVMYGIPVKPTTMSMIAYREDKAIIGVSSGLIHYPEENILDIVLPWIASGVKIPREFLISLGEGGLFSSFLTKYKYSKVSL
jgi:molybdopterin biosynthesis enzyme